MPYRCGFARRNAYELPNAGSACLSVRHRGGRAAADDRGGFVYQRVVGERLDHEHREVDPAGQVAGEHGVTDMPAPHGQPFAFALFEVTAAHDGPAGRAGEDAPARLDLVIEV